jgi:RimJ/RimL family protein N-acetyltransferase
MIEGKLTRLRMLEERDLPFLRELGNEPGVRNNVVGWDWPLSDAGQERWFGSSASSPATKRLLVEDKNGEPLGLTGLWDIDWHSRNALTALKLGGRDGIRGRGYGTDAIKTLMAFAFLDVGLVRLYSTILVTNEASVRAYCEKSGWTIEGRARQHVFRHGRYVDLHHIGILREDFEALSDSAEYTRSALGLSG